MDDFVTAAGRVEGEADCPHCPVWPPPAGLEMETAPEDAVFGQIVFALARGAGEARLSLDASAWLHDRYAPWLTATKPELLRSPLEVWETMGQGFLAKFKEIGEGARGAAGAEIRREDLEASALRWKRKRCAPTARPRRPAPPRTPAAVFYAGSGVPRVQLPA